MKPLITILCSLFVFSANCQVLTKRTFWLNFDTLDYQHSLRKLTIDTAANNTWQIGIPQKSVFNLALSGTRALVTDTTNACGPNDTSVCVLEVRNKITVDDTLFLLDNMTYWNKQDFEVGDRGYVEERQYGVTWDTVGINTGASVAWTKVTLPVQYGLGPHQTSTFRFTFVTDTSTQPRDGWMLDSIQLNYIRFVGIDDVDQIANIEVFPNPANDHLTVLTPSNDNFILFLHTADGKKMLERPVKGNARIDISALPAGSYFYRVEDGKGRPVRSGKLSIVR